MTLIQASKKSNEREVCSNLQNQRVRQRPKFKLGQLFRQLILKKYSRKTIVQITVIKYIH